MNTEMQNHNWDKLPSEGVIGKTLGIIGMGSIGRKLVSFAQAFSMHVLYYDTLRHEDLESSLNITYSTMEEIFVHSDYITLHVPLNKDTHHLIDATALARMRPTAYLINTSRGAVIDDQALCKELIEGRIAGPARFFRSPYCMRESMLQGGNLFIRTGRVKAILQYRPLIMYDKK